MIEKLRVNSVDMAGKWMRRRAARECRNPPTWHEKSGPQRHHPLRRKPPPRQAPNAKFSQ
jgi:hypothetical protein